MFGATLARLRSTRHATLADVGLRLGVSRACVHDYERERTDPPTARLSVLLAHLRASPVETVAVIRAAAPGVWPSEPVVSADDLERIRGIRQRWAGMDTGPIFRGRTRVQLTDQEAEVLAGAAEDVAHLLGVLGRLTEPAEAVADELVIPSPAGDAAGVQEAA